MHTFGKAQMSLRMWQAVGPWASGIHDRARADSVDATCFNVFERAMPQVSTRCRFDVTDVIQRSGAAHGGGTYRVDYESGIVGETVEIADGSREVFNVHAGQQTNCFVAAEHAAAAEVAHAAQQVVDFCADG